MYLNICKYVTSKIETNIYILEENQHAIIVDTSCEKDFLNLLESKKVKIDAVILTHEHYDHISGVPTLKKIYSIPIIASEICNTHLQDARKNFSHYFDAFYELQHGTKFNINKPIKDFTCHADKVFKEMYQFEWQKHQLYLRETPGHTDGSICIIVDGNTMFAGDTLLPDSSVVARFPGGSKKKLLEKTIPYLKSLSANMVVYPGHGDVFLLGSHSLYKTG